MFVVRLRFNTVAKRVKSVWFGWLFAELRAFFVIEVISPFVIQGSYCGLALVFEDCTLGIDVLIWKRSAILFGHRSVVNWSCRSLASHWFLMIKYIKTSDLTNLLIKAMQFILHTQRLVEPIMKRKIKSRCKNAKTDQSSRYIVLNNQLKRISPKIYWSKKSS
jgi:hypothetical protein